MYIYTNHARIEGEPIQQIESILPLRPKYSRPSKFEDFHDTRLRLRLENLRADHLLLSPDFDAHDVCNATLIIDDQLGKSREESRTFVLFGQLAIDRSHDTPLNELVAVKYTSPGLAVREFCASNSLASKGLSVYRPLGFIGQEQTKHRVGLITSYNHSSYSLDNILWDPELFEQEKLRTAAIGAAAL